MKPTLTPLIIAHFTGGDMLIEGPQYSYRGRIGLISLVGQTVFVRFTTLVESADPTGTEQRWVRTSVKGEYDMHIEIEETLSVSSDEAIYRSTYGEKVTLMSGVHPKLFDFQKF